MNDMVSFQRSLRTPSHSVQALMQFCVGEPMIYRAQADDCAKNIPKNHEISFLAPEEPPRSESLNEFQVEKKEKLAPQQRGEELARLESVLFLAREPLSSRKLAQYSEISSVSRVHSLLRELSENYLQQPCAFFIVEVAGGYQLRTRSQFAPWLVRLQEVPIEIRLSSMALETLAIVAKKQPVLRATIESIRGAQCGETLRQLLERNLIKIVGRSEELGRPFLYGTTKLFLQIFGLKKIEELFSEKM